jgi:hypothetical protein
VQHVDELPPTDLVMMVLKDLADKGLAATVLTGALAASVARTFMGCGVLTLYLGEVCGCLPDWISGRSLTESVRGPCMHGNVMSYI